MRATSPLLATLGVILAAPAAWADIPCPTMPGIVEEMDQPELYIEFHAADEDLGVHGDIDSDGATALCIYDPSGQPILSVTPDGQLADLGIASLFFESREPPLEDYTHEMLQAAFAEGAYRIEALHHDGTGMAGTVAFSTVLPTMPNITSPGFALDEEDATPIEGDIVIQWDPVTRSIDGRPLQLAGYQFTVSTVGTGAPGGPLEPDIMIDVPPEVTSFTVPSELLTPDTLWEVEVLAVTTGNNRTIGLKWFKTP